MSTKSNKAGLIIKPIHAAKADKYYKRAAVGIVKQAVCDFYYFHKRIEHCEKMIEVLEEQQKTEYTKKRKSSIVRYKSNISQANRELARIKKFFYSDWIKMLIKFDGPTLYKHLEKLWASGVRGIYRESYFDWGEYHE